MIDRFITRNPVPVKIAVVSPCNSGQTIRYNFIAPTQSSKKNKVMDQQEVHISSMVVHARPDHLQSVKNDIEQLPGTEIQGEADSGKLVVVLETQKQSYITDIIEKINNLENVLSIALVYHQVEYLDSLPEQ